MGSIADLSCDLRQDLADCETLHARIFRLRRAVTYRILFDEDDLDQAFLLRHRAYVAAGGASERASKRLDDDYDGTPNSAVVGIWHEGVLCASARLHLVRTPGDASPAFATFPDVLAPLLAAGETFIDTNCFCVDPLLSGAIPEFAYLTFRIPVMAAEVALGSLVTATVRQGHVGFYRRLLYGRVAAPPRAYPGRTKPFTLILVDYQLERSSIIGRSPFLAPDPGEPEAIGMDRIGRGSKRQIVHA